jgi:sugar/nucleoside kinase (ribokinase family)
VFGDLMTDVVASIHSPVAWDSDTPANIQTFGGGSAANVAAWLATTGARVVFVARRGDDPLGRTAEADLSQAGVDCRFVVDPGRPTGTCVVVSDGSARSMFPDRGANAGWRAADIPTDIHAAITHVSGYPLLSEEWRPLAAALSAARASGSAVSVDPSSAALIHEVGPEEFLRRIGPLDLIKPNRDEALALTGLADPEAAGAQLLKVADKVVVTLDRDGALLLDRAGTRMHAPPPQVEVVDTTGAGDAFTAGLLSAWLHGDGPERLLNEATRTAAACLGVVGARPSVRIGAD